MSANLSTQPPTNRKRILLIGGLVFALVVTLFFGFRLVNRFRNRPTFEPVRGWMSVPYVARAYGIPPHQIADALGLPDTKPPDLRPIGEIAKSQGKTEAEVIALLQARINQEMQRRESERRPKQPRPPAMPTPTP